MLKRKTNYYVPATGKEEPVGMLMRPVPIGELGDADSQSPDQVQHGLKSYSFVQFLLDRNKTTQTQKRRGRALISVTVCQSQNAEVHAVQKIQDILPSTFSISVCKNTASVALPSCSDLPFPIFGRTQLTWSFPTLLLPTGMWIAAMRNKSLVTFCYAEEHRHLTKVKTVISQPEVNSAIIKQAPATWIL